MPEAGPCPPQGQLPDGRGQLPDGPVNMRGEGAPLLSQSPQPLASPFPAALGAAPNEVSL